MTARTWLGSMHTRAEALLRRQKTLESQDHAPECNHKNDYQVYCTLEPHFLPLCSICFKAYHGVSRAMFYKVLHLVKEGSTELSVEKLADQVRIYNPLLITLIYY